MRLKGLRGKGWIPLKNEFSIDMDSLNGTITAVVGGNGQGKSSLLELFAACLYRKMPTRGSLKDFAITRDSFIECSIVNGNEYHIRQTVDGVSGKAETSLTGADGQALLTSAKVTEFQRWADKHLPAPAIFYSSLFAAQGSRGLLGMDPAERKSTILKVLGLERLEALAQLARLHKSEADKELAGVRARLDELRGTQAPEVYAEEVLRLQADVRTAEEELRLGEITLTDLRVKNEVATKAKAEMDATVARIRDLEARENGVVQRIAEMKRKMEEAKAISDEGDKIKDAITRTKALESELAELNSKRQEVEKREISTVSAWHHLQTEHQRLIQEAVTLVATVDGLASAETSEQSAREAGDKVLEYAPLIKETIAIVDSLSEQVESVRGESTATLSTSRAFLRGELQYIADEKAKSPKDYAYSALVADATAVKEAEDHPAKLDKAKRALLAADLKVKELEHERAVLQRTADRLAWAQEEKARCLEAGTHLAKNQNRQEGLVKEKKAVEDEKLGLAADLHTISGKIGDVTREIQTLKPLADKSELLSQAETRVVEYTDRLGDLHDEKEKLLADRGDLNDTLPAVAPMVLKLDEYIDAVAVARNRAEAYRRDLSVAENSQAAAEQAAGRRTAYSLQLKDIEGAVADWTRLADDLGKGGLQALEIDCAGPELTTLANDLLRSCGDTRFSVEVSTTRQDSTGKKELEVCDILVMDSQDGLTQSAESLSGGEAVFVGEALSLALTMVGVRRSGVSAPTLIRDETGAALDPERGPQYIAMLRRAAEIVGASRILFVSHSADLQALSDSTIRIDNGVITVS